VISQTFLIKAYGMAGIRLGVYASAEIIAVLNKLNHRIM
jgi:histidinol-phosphate/aromatic aminotransferase/cobyric acid decarboxylase-like protein